MKDKTFVFVILTITTIGAFTLGWLGSTNAAVVGGIILGVVSLTCAVTVIANPMSEPERDRYGTRPRRMDRW